MPVLDQFSRPAALVGRFFGWWLSELASLIPTRLRELISRPKTAIAIYVRDDGISLGKWNGRKHESLPNDERSAALQNTLSRHRRRGAEIILCIPKERSLSKEITLPFLPANELRQTLFYQIDRQTPFSNSDAYFDFSVTERSADHIRLSLTVVPPKVILQEEAVLTAHKIEFDRIAIGDANDNGPPRLDLRKGPEPSPNKGASRFLLNSAMALLTCGLLIATIYQALAERRSALETLSSQIAHARTAANEASELEDQVLALRKELTFFADRKRSRPMVLSILLELTRALPDHTWLNELHYGNDQVRLAGYSSAAAAVISQIDKSPMFSEPHFRSPIIQDAATGKERFQLTFKISKGGER